MAKRFPELAALEDRTECRQILLDIVDRNVERLHEILKTHEENADAEAERVVAQKGFDTGPRCKQLSDYELKYDRAYRQSLAMYEKMTGERRGAWNGKDETWRGGPARQSRLRRRLTVRRVMSIAWDRRACRRGESGVQTLVTGVDRRSLRGRQRWRRAAHGVSVLLS